MAEALEPNQISRTVDGYGSQQHSEISLNLISISNYCLVIIDQSCQKVQEPNLALALAEAQITQFKEPHL